jgi:hypothetical protein
MGMLCVSIGFYTNRNEERKEIPNGSKGLAMVQLLSNLVTMHAHADVL